MKPRNLRICVACCKTPYRNITVGSGVQDDQAIITIADTGHGIIEEHGGRISVESAVGEGTPFRIHLPLATESVGDLIH